MTEWTQGRNQTEKWHQFNLTSYSETSILNKLGKRKVAMLQQESTMRLSTSIFWPDKIQSGQIQLTHP